MKKALLIITLTVLFISVFSALSVMSSMVSKYNECKGQLFSSSPVCDMVDLGNNLNTGVLFMGLFFTLGVWSAYFLIDSVSEKKSNPYASFR